MSVFRNPRYHSLIGSERIPGVSVPVSSIGIGATTITSGTAGSVLFIGTAGLLSQNNSQFFWDNTNFRLGINTATPSGSIDVGGSRFLVASNGAVTIAPSSAATNLTLKAQGSSSTWISFLNSSSTQIGLIRVVSGAPRILLNTTNANAFLNIVQPAATSQGTSLIRNIYTDTAALGCDPGVVYISHVLSNLAAGVGNYIGVRMDCNITNAISDINTFEINAQGAADDFLTGAPGTTTIRAIHFEARGLGGTWAALRGFQGGANQQGPGNIADMCGGSYYAIVGVRPTFTSCTVTIGLDTIDRAAGGFQKVGIGATISHASFPGGTTVVAINSDTQIQVSNIATASASPTTVTIYGVITNCDVLLCLGASSTVSGDVTNFSSLRIENPTITGTVTNNYGIRIEARSGGTNPWAIYSLGGVSSHLGRWHSGANTTPTAQFQITGRENIVQLFVKGNSTQSANIFTMQNSSSTNLLTLTNGAVLTLGTTALAARQAITTNYNGSSGVIHITRNATGFGGGNSLYIDSTTTNTSTGNPGEDGIYVNIVSNSLADTGVRGLLLNLSGTSSSSFSTGVVTAEGLNFNVFGEGNTAWEAILGVTGVVYYGSTGILSNAYASNVNFVTEPGGGKTTNASLYYAQASSIAANVGTIAMFRAIAPVAAGGTIDELRGLWLANMTGATTNWAIYSEGGQSSHAGNYYFGGNTAPTAKIHIAAGSTAASSAPIKLTSGTSMTTAEAGAIEYTTDDLFFTIATGTARKRLLMADPVGGLTSGRIPFVTTNGRLTDDSDLTFSTDTLTVTKIVVGAGASVGKLDHGTYTPTLTNAANLAASTAYECQYIRVGNTVVVSGKVDVDPTLAATATQLGISLPIASNFGAQEDCGGSAFASGIAGQGAAIRADATNDRAEMVWVSGDITNQSMYFTFQYQVI